MIRARILGILDFLDFHYELSGLHEASATKALRSLIKQRMNHMVSKKSMPETGLYRKCSDNITIQPTLPDRTLALKRHAL